MKLNLDKIELRYLKKNWKFFEFPSTEILDNIVGQKKIIKPSVDRCQSKIR